MTRCVNTGLPLDDCLACGGHCRIELLYVPNVLTWDHPDSRPDLDLEYIFATSGRLPYWACHRPGRELGERCREPECRPDVWRKHQPDRDLAYLAQVLDRDDGWTAAHRALARLRITGWCT